MLCMTVSARFLIPPAQTVEKENVILWSLYDCFAGAAGGETILTHKQEKHCVFVEALDKVLRCLNDRFGNIGQYKFIKLLDVPNFREFRVKLPEDTFLSLKNSIYVPFFDLVPLKSNLITVYKRDDIPSHLY